ncbi:hypothetical protein FQN51_009555 [Onygenales sp. PD_10]|nr:hypothetical protein FQN51_009555 [Onygenales sp. PD_10]
MIVLPQEIIELVVLFSNNETRRQLLTVSYGFQAAVERSSWNTYINRSGSNLQQFLAMYHGHRVRFLRAITINLQFPEIRNTEEPPRCRETADEAEAHNEHLELRISAVFRALKTLEERGLPNNHPNSICLTVETARQPNTNNHHCDHRKYHNWRIRLLNPQILPSISSVRTLVIGDNTKVNALYSNERPLDLGTVAILMSKLPNLEVLDCRYLHERFPNYSIFPVLSHFTRPWEGPWRDSRHSFGKEMRKAMPNLPAKIKMAKLHFSNGRDGNLGWHVDQNVPLPDLVKPLSYDPLSSALRVFSQRLTELDLRVYADSSLFWPSPGESDTAPPFWPYLKRLSVAFQPASPSGVWYFQGPDGEGRDAVGYEVTKDHYPPLTENEADKEWDKNRYNEESSRLRVSNRLFRVIPIDKHLEPLLEAFAKALGNMPLLEEARLETTLGWRPSPTSGMQGKRDRFRTANWWSVSYNATSGPVPVLTWRTVGGWRPSQRLQSRFVEVGRQGSRGGMEVRWIDDA